jgi:hypothetical protein
MNSGTRNERDGRYTLASEISHTDVDGYTIILDCRNGVYIGLNGVASEILGMLCAGERLADVSDAIARDYQIDVAVAHHDAEACVTELVSRGVMRAV